MFEDSLSIAKAQIRHRRFHPKAHDFQSSLSYLCFDPDRIDQNLDRSWLCSTSRWNILNLYENDFLKGYTGCLLYTSPSPRDKRQSRMPSSA